MLGSKSIILGTLLTLPAAAVLQGSGGGGSAPVTPSKKPSGITVVVGSGGCDGQDTHCKDDAAAEKVMTFLSLSEDGKLQNWTSTSEIPGNAAWFAVKQGCMFATFPGQDSIEAFKWTADAVPTKVLTLAVGAKGANPVFGDVSTDGKVLVVANYHGPDDGTDSTGASVQTFTIAEDCSLAKADLKPHNGSSVNKARQGAAHPHSTVVGRTNNLVFVCDLGMDIIFTYSIDSEGKLTELARTPTKAGSGPRHSVMHPTKDILFVVSEMGSEVSTYQIDEKTGKLSLVADITTLSKEDPQPPAYGSKAAELAITPDGKHLYASNRAFDDKFKNTVAVYDIAEDGKLTLTQQVECPAFPRGMTLMPDGKHLLVASQTDGEVASFKVDANSGHLTPTGSTQKGPWGAAAFAILPAAESNTNSVVV